MKALRRIWHTLTGKRAALRQALNSFGDRHDWEGCDMICREAKRLYGEDW